MIDARNNFQVWSETYDLLLDDVFRVQREIAEAVAAKLQVALGIEDAARIVTPTKNLEAFDLYLNGRARMRERGQGVHEAVRLFEEATLMDPNWAPAWTALAQAYGLVPYYPTPGEPPPDSAAWAAALDASEEAARRALAIDPENASAEVALGAANRDRWSWDDAEPHFLRALAIDPDDPEAHQQYADYLAAVGRLDEALRSARRVLDLDAGSVIRLNTVGYLLLANGRVTESAVILERAVAQRPPFSYPYRNLARANLLLGKLDAAMSALESAGSYDPARLVALRRAWSEHDGAALAACCDSIVNLAVYMVLGDTAQAIARITRDWLDAPHFRADYIAWLWQPEIDGIRSDPRVQPALRRLGLEGVAPHRVPPQ